MKIQDEHRQQPTSGSRISPHRAVSTHVVTDAHSVGEIFTRSAARCSRNGLVKAPIAGNPGRVVCAAKYAGSTEREKGSCRLERQVFDLT